MSDYDIHSILEFGDRPAPGLWWVLSPSGESPPIRAGAECLVRKCPQRPELDSEIVLSGGGTPHGFIDDVTKLSFLCGAWTKLSKQGFTARYEHVMVEVDSKPVVFLGSNAELEPLAQCLENDSWTKADFEGHIPSARSVSQTARIDNKTYIWSGGCEKGPVSDVNLYVVEESRVHRQKLSGEIPPPLQEFAMAADSEFIFIHGGLGANGMAADMFRINRRTFRSKRCQIIGDKIGPIAMHKMVSFGKDLYLFGGLMENDVVSDQLFRLRLNQSGQYVCGKIECETRPTPRLAFNFAVINLPVKKVRQNPVAQKPDLNSLDEQPQITPIDDWKVTIDGENVEADVAKADESGEKVDLDELEPLPVLFIHGGCDAQGEFFNDLYISTIPL